MKNALIVLVVLVLLGGGYWYMKNYSSQAPQPAGTSEEVTTTPEAMTDETATDSSDATGAKEFTVDGKEFAFDVKTITVKKGDTVKVTLTNSGKMPHDWVVDEFTGAKTKQIKNGETDTVTFVADVAGTYEYYCSVGQHRANGMVGKLIVE